MERITTYGPATYISDLFFLYNMGVQTVMYVATLFGDGELHLPSEILIAIILIIQFVAIGGAYLFSRLSKNSVT